ncbi:MAG: phenylalanyl-tRNA synthetase alpha chain, partial [Natronomonas sp.]
MKLPETQLALLEAAGATDRTPVGQLAEELDEDPAAITRAAFELEAAGLVDVEERVAADVTLTEEGERYRDAGLPELRLRAAAAEAGADESPAEMGRLLGRSGLDGPEVDIALSNLARKGYGEIDGGAIALSEDPRHDPESDPEVEALDSIASGEADAHDADVLDRLESRGLVERSETTVRSVTLTE